MLNNSLKLDNASINLLNKKYGLKNWQIKQYKDMPCLYARLNGYKWEYITSNLSYGVNKTLVNTSNVYYICK